MPGILLSVQATGNKGWLQCAKCRPGRREMEDIPLYCIVSKFSPTRFGSKNEFFVKSHVPSPTVMVLEE